MVVSNAFARRSAAAFLLVAFIAVPACTVEQPPLSTDALGTVSFETSCGGEVQPRFDRAVALLHHMTYPEAMQAFQQIADASPGCAMAHWGLAMTRFQPLWPTRPTPEDLELGWADVQRAKELGAATAREAAYVAMAEAFFAPGLADYWTRIARWEAAARDLYEAFPDDRDAAAFHALAQLATAPADGGTQHNERAAGILTSILEEQPAHPGAVHYMIHANDAAGRERNSPDVVRRYLDIAPRNPHALHMPTHIFVRVGEWEDAIEWNRRAAEAALEQPAGDQGQWVWDEFPHAIEYMVYAQLQRGDDAAAADAIQSLQDTPDLQPSFKTAFHLSSTPARYALERHAWSEAAQLAPRPGVGLAWDQFPWPEAVTWFARGVGAARTADLSAARAAETRLAELRDVAATAGEQLFVRHVEILRLEVAAWIAHADRLDGRALELMRAAAELETTTPKPPVTPAPTLPAYEQLGDLLAELGRPAEALDAYRASLGAAPKRLNSLLGAARAADAAGRTAEADSFRHELREQLVPVSPRPGLLNALTRPVPAG